MPYWSSSRVGIQPQPDSTNNNKSNKNHGGKSRSERFSSRQKGITMEDLKKQTALRLAEEQSRQRGGGGSRQQRGNHHNRSSSAASAATAQQQPPNNPQSSRGAATVPPIATQPQPQPPQQPQREAYPVERGTTRGGQPQPRTGPPPPPSAAAPHPYLSASVSPYHKNPHSVSAVPVPQAPHVVVNHANNNNPAAALNHSASFSIAETASTVSSSSAGTHHSASTKPSPNANANNNKSKLPHGLTVQELKEMTKARLQAEAASSQGPTASGASAGASGAVAAASAPPPPQENVAASAAAASIPPPSQLNRTSSRGAAPSPLAFAAPQDWQASEWDRTGLAAPSVDFTNRPRAVTLSPRFALLEEEPLARERALSSSEMALPPLRPASSDQQQQPLYPMTGNRDRTSSAASLPPMSETAQEFGLGATTTALPPPFGSVSEEPAVTEAVEPSTAANASSYLSDVFRTALFDSTDSADEPRIRAATWSEPLFGSCGTADALPYTELASILKLSGASEQTEEQGADNDICEDVL